MKQKKKESKAEGKERKLCNASSHFMEHLASKMFIFQKKKKKEILSFRAYFFNYLAWDIIKKVLRNFIHHHLVIIAF